MGYYTDFQVQVNGKEQRIKDFCSRINDKAGFCVFPKEHVNLHAPNECVAVGFEAKWYNCEEDFMEVCKDFPDLSVEIEGQGASKEDWWYCRIENRECYRYEAEVIPPWDTGVSTFKEF